MNEATIKRGDRVRIAGQSLSESGKTLVSNILIVGRVWSINERTGLVTVVIDDTPELTTSDGRASLTD